MGVVSELRRRNVFRMAVLYVVAAWAVMQAAEVLIGLANLPDWVGPTILAVLAVGFPIALVFSWFFEVTPEGLALEKEVPSSQSITHVTGRRMDFVIIAILSAGLLLFAYDKWWIDPPPERSIAVLPFVAMSSSEDDGFFADGLTEEILNSLTQLPELRVTARTSSFFFKDKDVPVAEIASLLNVAHIVEGSVRRDGEKLRITSQLIRVADGFHLWSQTYDRRIEDVFVIQQDIAERVAEALNVVLDEKARERMRAMRINNVDAFIAYQKGLRLFQKAHDPDPTESLVEVLATANTYFDKAIEVQPNLIGARMLKTDRAGHLLMGMIDRDESSIDSVKDQVEALRAELDLAWRASPSGNQRDILALEKTLVGDDWTGLSTLIDRAMQPGACPRINHAETLWNLGFARELARKLEELLVCNPLDADVIFRLAKAYTISDRPDESFHLLSRAEAAGVNSTRFSFARNYARIVAGRLDGFEFEYYAPIFGEVMRHLIQGNEAKARQIAEEIWRDPDMPPGYSLRLATILGDRTRANEFAGRMDKYPGGPNHLTDYFSWCKIFGRLVKAGGCQHGVPFDLEATPNLKARIEESGLQWPPVAFLDASTERP